MTDRQGRGKCEVTDEYLSVVFDGSDDIDDYRLIKNIGIRLSKVEALMYLSLPEFHREYLEKVDKWYQIRKQLYHYSNGADGVNRAIGDYFSVKNYELSEVMQIKHIQSLVFPFLVRLPKLITNFNPNLLGNTCEVSSKFLSEMLRVIREKIIVSSNLSSSELYRSFASVEGEKEYFDFLKSSDEDYRHAVVSLSDLERIAYDHLDSKVLPVLYIWRQYLEAKKKQKRERNLREMRRLGFVVKADELDGDSVTLEPSLNKASVVKKNQEWESMVFQKHQNNPALRHKAICEYLAAEPELEPELHNAPDGLSIPWLMKEAKRKRQLPGRMIEAAYRLYRKRNKQNHSEPEELFSLMTPDCLPDFIKWRNQQVRPSSVRVRLVDDTEWDYQNFSTNHRKLFNMKLKES